MVPPSAQAVVAGLIPDAAIAAMPTIWREAATGPAGLPSRNQFAACLATLKSRLGVGPEGKLPSAVFTALRAEAQRATAQATTDWHKGALYAKHGERFTVAKHGIGGDNGAEVVGVRITRSAHQLTEAQQAAGALVELTGLRKRLESLCTDDAPHGDEARNGVLSRAKRMLARGKELRQFCPKASPLRLSGWLGDHAKAKDAETAQAVANKGKSVQVAKGAKGSKASDLASAKVMHKATKR